MKRFRWGDVVPGFSEDPYAVEDEILEQVGVYAAVTHGERGLDPIDADAAHRLLVLVD